MDNNSTLDIFYGASSSNDTVSDNLFCWYNDEKGRVLTLTVVSIFLPLTLMAICSLYFEVKRSQAIPVYIINLLISDTIQISSMVMKLAGVEDSWGKYGTVLHVYDCGVVASVFFMMLIALERYLMISRPLWYRLKRTAKFSVSACAVCWILSALSPFISYGFLEFFFLLPFPFLIFFFVGTVRSLSAAQNVPVDEKRQILAILIVVCLIYAVMFMPRIIENLVSWKPNNFNYITYDTFFNASCTLIQISPLTDLILYIFFKKGVINKPLAFLCCCIKKSDQPQQIDSLSTTTRSSCPASQSREGENP